MGSDREVYDDGERGEARGHIKIARKAFTSDVWWLRPREFSKWEAWVDVIQLAAFRDRRYSTDHGVIDLRRGEFVASLRYLGARWHWTVKRVRIWLTTAQKGARIRAQRETGAGTVYLIVNYDIYQSGGHTKRASKGTAEDTEGAQQGHKIEAVKAVEAVKTDTVHRADEDPAFDVAWKDYPHRHGSNPRHAALAAWRARREEGYTSEEMTAGVRRYRLYAEAEQIIGKPFVMQGKRFLGPGREFLEAWGVDTDPAEAAIEAERAKQDEDERWLAPRLNGAHA